jgi:hypothetical protein
MQPALFGMQPICIRWTLSCGSFEPSRNSLTRILRHACLLSRRWVPVQERSRSLALVYSGMYTGSILGLALSPHMIEARACMPARMLARPLRMHGALCVPHAAGDYTACEASLSALSAWCR